jgi:hypothetical protein
MCDRDLKPAAHSQPGKHRREEASPRSALRASLGRILRAPRSARRSGASNAHLAPRSARGSDASNAAGPAAAVRGSLRRTWLRAPRVARAHLAPRSARRSGASSAHLAPRSARRSGASNAAGPAVAAYGRKPAAHRRSQGRHRGARKAPPRSALRASLGRPLRSSPRSALRASLGTHGPTSAPRSWRRAWGAGAPRWRAKAAALRGNLMAPERLLRGAHAPNSLHRSHCHACTWRARRQWRPHALARVLKVRKCHDGACNTLAKKIG